MMRNNIIAIAIFIGFIVTVFTLGYFTSGDSIPTFQSGTPAINTAGGRSIHRQSNNGLSLSQLSGQSSSHSSVGSSSHGTNSSSSVSSTSGGSLHIISNQTLHSSGGGTAATAGGGSTSSHGGTLGATNGGHGGVGMPALTYRSQRYSEIGDIAPYEPLVFAEQNYSTPRLGDWDDDENEPDDRPGPYENPVGEIPALLVLALCAIVAAKKYPI